MMGSICNDFRRAQTGDFRFDDLAWLKSVLREGHYLYATAEKIESAGDSYEKAGLRNTLARDLDTYLAVGGDWDEKGSAIVLNGQPIDTFTLALNSAIEWGNRAIQLCAKLHGQCEIHAYCEGEDRAWLADVIQDALDCRVFRPDAWGYDGWPAVIDFLRAGTNEPVVTSYSATDSFPNAAYAPEGALDKTEDGEIDWDAWYEIDPAQQWEWGMTALRKEPGLRISPDRLGRMFGDGLTGREFVLRAQDAQRETA